MTFGDLILTLVWNIQCFADTFWLNAISQLFGAWAHGPILPDLGLIYVLLNLAPLAGGGAICPLPL